MNPNPMMRNAVSDVHSLWNCPHLSLMLSLYWENMQQPVPNHPAEKKKYYANLFETNTNQSKSQLKLMVVLEFHFKFGSNIPISALQSKVVLQMSD